MKASSIQRLAVITRSCHKRTFTTHSALLQKIQPLVHEQNPIPDYLNFQQKHTHHNELIREIFDNPVKWKEFNKSFIPHTKVSLTGKTYIPQVEGSIGLFQNPYLTSPEGLLEFCEKSLSAAKNLVSHVIIDDSEQGKLNYIRNLDRLSDTLCRVIDLAEFIRVAHPDEYFVEAAQKCHEIMFEYMNVLNTTSDLFNKLESVLGDEKIIAKLSPEEISVGNLLLTDFLKSGISMDDSTKDNFIQLSQLISMNGQQFNKNLHELEHDSIKVDKKELTSYDSSTENSLIYSLSNKKKIPLNSRVSTDILRLTNNESLRKKIWLGLHQPAKGQITLLENFLKYRGLLAHFMGKSSFAEYQLSEKMAKTPENVMTFLKKNLKDIEEDVISELRTLIKFKVENSDKLSDEQVIEMVKPWDRDYLTTLYLSSKRSSNTEDISQYLSVGVVLQGLSDLFQSIYGIQFKAVPLKPGEAWHNGVRKFHVTSETEGFVGIIYLDLFHRESKTLNPAHFTVCCSRKIYPEELDENDPFKVEIPGKEGQLVQVSTAPDGTTSQLPVISLVCSFNQEEGGVSLLSLSQVETLFHEMGHAMHSMLGKTKLHNVSGTRCATDFVELPSILMEHFANDTRVLMSFAKHYRTNEPLPLKLLQNYSCFNSFLNNCETFGQIKMAILDQVLHSNVVFDKDFDSIDLYHKLETQLKIFADTESKWPGKFGHLFSYGAVYYSYLFDRAIAKKIWEHLFAKDPLSRENGEKFRNKVLKWGGSRDPWELVADVLDEPELKKGDIKAMEFIGRR
ncbi:Mitochondrial intermediate peptidase [Komagataella phaffii CBS 7435]|uniref:Mitochondrial intermediate peptidase n=2 Tax=Komagataella phaffii TaxID=460519 RepID=C4R0N9_KOMPG|nr:Mitochondrial intermediate peptidase [Komagataella phaffii GS115]AOA62462.1 GQ67_00481T0 [Komagataella phaffii]CAH2448418.1 Mitochondrial intermediate peptidase [Komagataella phaffii CBS 7435]AOA68057.1 GQ68_00908T0 [Komagataella phaffii GS115]CAY69063.1 Mitochondrial intermediate peptidase [Komagataella phaffii GS115]CCA38542.2 Mitochondrial intermediate peptidase [Komagataella phaffii CBS 7435]